MRTPVVLLVVSAAIAVHIAAVALIVLWRPAPPAAAGARDTAPGEGDVHAVTASLPPAPVSPGMGRATTVTAEMLHGVWVVRGFVNGDAEARVMVDTGAAYTIVSPRLATRLGIAPSPDAARIDLLLLNGRSFGTAIQLRSVRVGDIRVQGVEAVIHDVVAGAEMILGNSFLRRFRVTFDGDRRMLHLRQTSGMHEDQDCDP